MTLNEILAIEDIGKKITLLKEKRTTPMPNVKQLMDDWDSTHHAVMNEGIRKKRQVCVREEYTDEDGVFHASVYQDEDVNRIPLPIEQDIVNIHTAFTVGIEPMMLYTSNNNKEKNLYNVLMSVIRDNKMKYQNKRIVRSWLSEQEVVEYWYATKAKSFWEKVKAKFIEVITGKVLPQSKLKCVIWSPFRGDKLYPFFDDAGDYVAQSREYQIKESRTKTVTYFQTVTDTSVYVWKRESGGWVEVADKTFDHHFPKLPCIYGYRNEALCKEIRPIRERLEKLTSNYADCIDYHFFPYLILKGNLVGDNGLGRQDERRRQIRVEEGGDAYYLTWEQTPESIKLEMDSLLEKAYALTNTPRITFENMQSMGQVASGVAFRYTFMGAHMAVENHAEVMGEFFQRRCNFLVSAIGSLCPSLKDASESIDIDVEIVPYMIDNISDKLDIASKAIDAGLMSKQSAIMFVGITDKVEEELAQIKEEQQSGPNHNSNNEEKNTSE